MASSVLPSGSRLRNIVWQAIAVAVLVGVMIWLAHNAAINSSARRVGVGFDFLTRPANFPIAETLIDYGPGQPIAIAILAGFINTILISFVGIAFATILGGVIGIARVSRNMLASSLSGAYVEFVRNVPLLAHLFVIYVVLQGLPPLRSAISLGDIVFLCNRGLVIPAVSTHNLLTPLLIAGGLSIASRVLLGRWARRGAGMPNGYRPVWPIAIAIGLAGLFGSTLVLGGSVRLSLPRLEGLNFVGATVLSPELTALILGLTIYYSAFIAEIVRGGILSVPKGQVDAATALGLRPHLVLRLIILPQALRVIIPPTTSQYLDLAKTSSLAIAIGYPDLVAVINSVITDTGQAIECVALVMAAFLTINLSISAVMNALDAKTGTVPR